MKILLAGALVTMILTGCAAVRRLNDMEAEALLKQAGFTVRQADTPARLARLNSVPANKTNKVLPYTRDGRQVYVYADPVRCKCVYIGSPEAYARYLQLVEAEQAKLEQFSSEPMPSEWSAD
jgi:hypothetical protein